MGATTDFRRALQGVRLTYLSTLEAYRASIREQKDSSNDLLKVITTPKKEYTIDYIDHNYFILKEEHIRLMLSNQAALREMIMVKLMSILEDYLKSTLRIAFVTAPKLFSNVKSEQKFEMGHLVRVGSYSSIVSTFLDREIRKIGERSLSETADYFKKNLNIDFQEIGVRWERILQASRYRNLIVHSGSRYFDEGGRTKTIEIGHWFILQSIDDLYSLSVHIGKRLREEIENQKSLVTELEKSQLSL